VDRTSAADARSTDVSGVSRERWSTVGIFDRAKDAASRQREHLDAAVEKAGDFADEKTEGKYAEQVDKGQEMALDKLADMTADEPEQPA
jgi:hypothetical protein